MDVLPFTSSPGSSRGLAVYDEVPWVLLSISSFSLEAGLGWGRDHNCKGKGGCASRELGPAALLKHCSCSRCNLSDRGSQRELPLRVTCWPSAQLEMFIASITLVWNQVLLVSVVGWLVGKLGLCSVSGAVWENQERKRQTEEEEGQAALRGSVRRAASEALICLTPVSWVGEEPPAQEACPPGKLTCSAHVPVFSCAALPAMLPGLPPSSPGYVETCSASFPAFPSPFSEFWAWAIPKGNRKFAQWHLPN